MAEEDKTPLVTVLMPVYNAEKYLAEAIESILGQTFTDFEFLIINDGSTDDSSKIIETYTDSRIRYIENTTNLKLIATLNKGIGLAKGKYIARMDADDICYPQRLQKQVSFMEANTDVGVCGSWFESFGLNSSSESKYPVDDFDIRYTALYQCPFCHPTVILRTSVLIDNGLLYDAGYPHAEDYELWLRLSRVTRLANIPEFLLRYRKHDSNISKLESATQDRMSLQIRRAFFEEAGVEASDTDLELFRRFNYQDNSFTPEELELLGMLLSRLASAKSSRNYFSKEQLKPMLGEKWFQTCTNHGRHGNSTWETYNAHQISGKRVPMSDFFKLRLKTWIRK